MSLARALAGLLSSSSHVTGRHLLRPIAASPLSTAASGMTPDRKDAAKKKRPLRPSATEPAAEPEAPKPAAEPEIPKPAAESEVSKPVAAETAVTTKAELPKVPPLKETAPEPSRPSEIPWQAKVANVVHLVGSIGVKLQVAKSSDGVYSAASVLVHEETPGLQQFWIPIVFQGDLAEIAACHLKEKDVVYITGRLNGDKPASSVEHAQSSLQVVVHTLSFVQELKPRKKGFTLHEQAIEASNQLVSEKVDSNDSTLHLWEDLLANPQKWWDNRADKESPTSAHFRHKDSGQSLKIGKSTPEWVLLKLDKLDFKQTNVKKPAESVKCQWSDLVDNPENWLDFRVSKQNGMVKPRFPDFKNKSTQEGLWLDRSPFWLLKKIDGLSFAMPENELGSAPSSKKITDNNEIGNSAPSTSNKITYNSEIGNSAPSTSNKIAYNEKLWRNLLNHPDKWYDNRSKKSKPNQPDFKNKETGEALWLGYSTPAWVPPMLPPSDLE